MPETEAMTINEQRNYPESKPNPASALSGRLLEDTGLSPDA